MPHPSKWPARFPRFVLCLGLALFALSCRLHRDGAPAGATSRTPTAPDTNRELGALVMTMADEYIAALGEAVHLSANLSGQDPHGRALLASFLRNGVGASLDIAIDPNPGVSILDLLVLGSLQAWAFETHWIPAGIDPVSGARAAKRLHQAEDELWTLAARSLTQQQLDTLRGLIRDWIKANPDRTVVSLVRFAEFTDERRVQPGIHEPARGLLSQICAVHDVFQDTEAMVERLAWMGTRLPYVLGEQAELTAYRLADQPEVRNATRAVDSLAALAESLKRKLESLDGDLRGHQDHLFQWMGSERTNAVAHAFASLAAERKATLDDIASRQEQLGPLLTSLRETIQATTLLAEQLTGTASVVDRVAGRFAQDPGAAGEISLRDVRDTAIEAAKAAERWTALLERLDQTILATGTGEPADKLSLAGAALIDRVFWRTLILIVVTGGVVALVRRIPRARAKAANTPPRDGGGAS